MINYKNCSPGAADTLQAHVLEAQQKEQQKQTSLEVLAGEFHATVTIITFQPTPCFVIYSFKYAAGLGVTRNKIRLQT